MIILDARHDDGVLTLALNRPEIGNALGADLVEALIGAASAAIADEAVHTLVLRGAGKHFCTGLDLSDLHSASDGELLLRLVRIETLLALLWHAPLRTVALAQGRAWGAGADLFAVCEHRVAAADTTLRFPGAQFGIVLGTRRLMERVGADAARAAVIGGAEIAAHQALALGLASAIGEAFSLAAPRVSRSAAAAIRDATRNDHRDADLAALVRSASAPGLKARIQSYRSHLRAPLSSVGP
ncbi:MAG: enoyl-CoA hydratase/isomerase family protein [Burkholderiaceae bacterium]